MAPRAFPMPKKLMMFLRCEMLHRTFTPSTARR